MTRVSPNHWVCSIVLAHSSDRRQKSGPGGWMLGHRCSAFLQVRGDKNKELHGWVPERFEGLIRFSPKESWLKSQTMFWRKRFLCELASAQAEWSIVRDVWRNVSFTGKATYVQRTDLSKLLSTQSLRSWVEMIWEMGVKEGVGRMKCQFIPSRKKNQQLKTVIRKHLDNCEICI